MKNLKIFFQREMFIFLFLLKCYWENLQGINKVVIYGKEDVRFYGLDSNGDDAFQLFCGYWCYFKNFKGL